MAEPRPRGQDQQKPRVLGGRDRAALVWLEVQQRAATASGHLAALLDRNLAFQYHQVCALVNLVLLKLFVSRQVDRDRSDLGIGAQHLRMVRFDLKAESVPALHRRS